MKAFAYINPTNEKDAVAALSTQIEQSMPIGGGQDLLARMKDYVTQPDRIVNVKVALESTVTPLNGGLRIGAAMRMVDVAEHAQIAKMYPAFSAAAIEVGTPQIRNQATVGGNLNQRPRCWYYRNEEFVCFKKGGNQCFSPAGENQFHAILGGGPSYIVHPSSLAVPSVAYGATFRLAGPKGERMVAAIRTLDNRTRKVRAIAAIGPLIRIWNDATAPGFEPLVSEPSVSGVKPAATAQAEPLQTRRSCGSSRGDCGIPVVHVLPREVIGVLAHVQGADKHRAGRFEPGYQRRIARRRRTLAIDLRAGTRRQPGNVKKVLDRERNARERPLGAGTVDCSRLVQRALRGNIRERVERRI